MSDKAYVLRLILRVSRQISLHAFESIAFVTYTNILVMSLAPVYMYLHFIMFMLYYIISISIISIISISLCAIRFKKKLIEKSLIPNRAYHRDLWVLSSISFCNMQFVYAILFLVRTDFGTCNVHMINQSLNQSKHDKYNLCWFCTDFFAS